MLKSSAHICRTDAAVRKVEQLHKEQLMNIHRESIRLLRVINRFKESMAVTFDKENLGLAASDIRAMPNLPIEDVSHIKMEIISYADIRFFSTIFLNTLLMHISYK